MPRAPTISGIHLPDYPVIKDELRLSTVSLTLALSQRERGCVFRLDPRVLDINVAHSTNAYLLMKKAMHPLDDSGGHEGPPLQKFPHPGPLPEGEGIRVKESLSSELTPSVVTSGYSHSIPSG